MHREGEETSSSWTTEEDEEGEGVEVDFAVTPPNVDLFSELIPCNNTPLPAEPSASCGDGDDDQEEEFQHTVPSKTRVKASNSMSPSSPSTLNTIRKGNMATPSPSKSSIDEKGAQSDEKRERKEEGEINHKNAIKVWSEEDEKNLLALFLEYLRTEVGAPNDGNAFFDFAGGKLEKFQKRQVGDKLKRFRKKYEMNAKKEKRGRLEAFSNHHDQEIFAICKCIWGTKASAQDVMFPESIMAGEKDINEKMNECNLKDDEAKEKEEMQSLTKESRSRQAENAQIEVNGAQSSDDEKGPVFSASEGRDEVPSPLKNGTRATECKTSDPACPKVGSDVAILNKPEEEECQCSVPPEKASTSKPGSPLSVLKTKANGNTASGSPSQASTGSQNDRKREREEDGESRKKMNKIWSEEDEKNLLGLFREYLQMGDADPNDTNSFFNSAEGKLEKFQRQQVKGKLKRLRTKYQTNAKMEKSGRLEVFSTDHDQEIFAICKCIWGTKAKGKEEMQTLTKESRLKQAENAQIEVNSVKSSGDEREPVMAASEGRDQVPICSEDGSDVAILNKPKEKECLYSVPLQKASTCKPGSLRSALKIKENGSISSGSPSQSSTGAKNDRKREREEDDGESSKKTNRIWSEEDEKNLLGLFREYLQMGAADPNDMNSFLNFVEGKLEKFQKQQVKGKLKRLRTKYQTNAKMEKSGRLEVFSTDHDEAIFRICKGIWGKKAVGPNVTFQESVKTRGKAIHKEMNQHNCKKDAVTRKEKMMALRKECYSRQDENKETKLDKSQSCSDERRVRGESQDSDERPLIEEMKRRKRNTRKPALSTAEDGEDAPILNKPEDSTPGIVSWRLLTKTFVTFSGLQEAAERGIELLTKSELEQLEQDRKRLEKLRLNMELESLQIAAERARLALEVMKAAGGLS